MPTGGKKITVYYADGSSEVYTVSQADLATIVEGEVLKFKGTLSGEQTAKSWGIKTYKKYSIEDN